MFNQNSRLFNFILNNADYIDYLDKEIREDIEKINNSCIESPISKKINLRVSELKKIGLNSNYLDLELLRMIVFEENMDVIVNNIKSIGIEFINSDYIFHQKNDSSLKKLDNLTNKIKGYREKIGQLTKKG